MKSNFDRLLARTWRVAAGCVAIGAVVWLGPATRIVFADDAKTADAGQFYKVQVLHPAKVGDRMHMKRDIDLTVTASTEQNGKPAGSQTESNQISFSGNLEVLGVNKDGEPVRWKVTGGVAGVKGAASAGHDSLLKPGAEFIVSFSGGKAVVANSDERHPVSEDAKKILPIVFGATGGRGDASLDDILDNSTAPRTGNWSLNSKAMVAALQSFDPKLKQSDVTGTASIKAVSSDGDKKVLMVEYEFKANSKKPSNPPTGTTPVNATLTENGTLSIPADASTGYFSGKVSIHTNGTFKKMTNKRESDRVGYRTIIKTVQVHDQVVIDENEKVNTLITYGSGDEKKKDLPSASTSKPSESSSSTPSSSTPSSTTASNGGSSGS